MPETPSPHTVFVSHAHADNELCDRYVNALRARGLDVWYDRTNMQAGHSLSSDIEAELRRRTGFVVIATPTSLASQWVRSEIAAFRSLASHDPTRLFLPVRAAEVEMPLLWADILWIDAVSLGFEAAVDEMAVALGTPAGTSVPEAQPAPVATSPAGQPTESVGELIRRAHMLVIMSKPGPAIPLLERATQLSPRRADAWYWLGKAYFSDGRPSDALAAYDRVMALNPKYADTWGRRIDALRALGRDREVMEAMKQAIDATRPEKKRTGWEDL